MVCINRATRAYVRLHIQTTRPNGRFWRKAAPLCSEPLSSPHIRNGLQQVLKLKRCRELPIEDPLGDSWREECEPEDATDVGVVDFLGSGEKVEADIEVLPARF